MIRRLLIASLFFVGIGLLGQAAQAAVFCNEHAACPQGSSCVDNRCVSDRETTGSPQTAPDRGAERECGTDRRCRIARLKRKNRARRQIGVIREERRLQRIIDAEYQREHDSLVRRAHPWLLDLHMRAETGAGVLFGYAFTPRVRLEGIYHSDEAVTYFQVDDEHIDGNHDFRDLSIGPTYFFSDGEFVPYVRGAFAYRFGEFYSWQMASERRRATKFHILTGGAGVDAQFDNGFHLRAGLLLHLLLYNQASIDVGRYDDAVRRGFNDEFFPLDLELSFGWAF